MNTEYNGWTNYATWRINLEWGFGDYSEEYVDYSEEGLQELVEEMLLEQTGEDNLAYQYALAFISDVNWNEIRNHIQENEGAFEDEA